MLTSMATIAIQTDGFARALAAVSRLDATQTPLSVAGDEDFWATVQSAYAMDRTFINLNNGGVSPSPRVVMDAVKRYMDYTNSAPARNLWSQLEPNAETVREKLAKMFGCSAEEIAITRNASESLQTVQLGMNLKSGDEVVTTTQDYPRMITTWEQRVRRDGIVLKKAVYPVPLIREEDYVKAIEKEITSKTKVIHISQVPFCSGQITPVRSVCRLAKSRGIECIVDGAHAFAQFPFTQKDLECDYYGTSLHKWLSAPIGTGMLYVKKEKIKDIWPLMAAGKDMDENIRKFEEIGTHPAALHNAIADAITFCDGIGLERKAARLRYIHHRWIDRLRAFPNVHFLQNIDDEKNWCGLVLFSIDGMDGGKIGEYLLSKHRIITTPITYAEINGVRITPNVYTTLSEIDYFADVLETIAKGQVKEVMASAKKD
jgi:selenocysteine lyase/cysteine desulfurase